MSGDVFIIGMYKNNNEEVLTMPEHPKRHLTYESALKEAKRLCTINKIGVTLLIFKLVLVKSVKQLEPVFEVVDFPDSCEKASIDNSDTEEQQPAVSKEVEPLEPNNPYLPNKMVRSVGPMVQLYTLDPSALFVYNKTTYRLLHSSYPYKAKVFNTETKQEEDISSCVYVIPVEEQAKE